MPALTPQALQDYLYGHIPLSKAMAVEVMTASPQGVCLAAPLAPNINHRDTVFGGSASAVAILSAWALSEAAAPIPEKWQRFLATLLKHKRARISVQSVLNCEGQQVGKFEGEFVAIII